MQRLWLVFRPQVIFRNLRGAHIFALRLGLKVAPEIHLIKSGIPIFPKNPFHLGNLVIVSFQDCDFFRCFDRFAIHAFVLIDRAQVAVSADEAWV